MRRSVEERFWANVDKSGDCWEWVAGKDRHGYGRFKHKQSNQLVHRIAWELTNGPIPAGLSVLHRCDNPSCVNPDHLFLGTQADNMRDMIVKGRSRCGSLPGEKNPRAKLTAIAVREIRKRYAAGGVFQKELATEFKVAATTVGNIVNKKRWKSVST